MANKWLGVTLAGFALFMAAMTNPSQEQYSGWLKDKATEQSGNIIEKSLISFFAKPLINTSTSHEDWVFFSIFRTDIWGDKIYTLGLLNNFIPLSNLSTNTLTNNSVDAQKPASNSNGAIASPLQKEHSDSTLPNEINSFEFATVTAAEEDVIRAQANVIKSKGFIPVSTFANSSNFLPNAKVSDGFGNIMYAWDVEPTPVGDGSIHQAFFFIGKEFLGTDTLEPHGPIKSVKPNGTGSIEISYVVYRPNDPMCCPTGTPYSITYHWNGKNLIPNAPFQNQYSNK